MKNSVRNSLLATTLGAALLLAAGCGNSSGSTSPSTIPISTTTPISVNLGLWVANGTNVLEFAPSLTTTAGISDPIPTLTLDSASFTAPQGVQFDSSQNLWVIDGGNTSTSGTNAPAIFQFTTTQLEDLGAEPTQVPNLTLTSPAFVFPQQAVFEGGDLFVTDTGANEVFVFTATQLADGGSQSPTVTISSNPGFTGPLGIAFSPVNGSLYIANNGGTTIYGFNAASLPTSSGPVTLTPSEVLSSDGSSIQAPWGLTFDSSGDLYASNANAPDSLVEFSASTIGSTGSPNPLLTIDPATDSSDTTLTSPNGIALDNLGDLAAISSASPFGIPVYASGQLSTSGSTIPDVFLVGTDTTLSNPAGCTFGPIFQ